MVRGVCKPGKISVIFDARRIFIPRIISGVETISCEDLECNDYYSHRRTGRRFNSHGVD